VPTLKENSAGHGIKLISKGMHGSAEYRKQVLDAERIIPGCQFFVVTHYSTPFLFIFRPILSKKGVKGNYFSYFVSGVKIEKVNSTTTYPGRVYLCTVYIYSFIHTWYLYISF
jgi:hypothetical protein